MKAHLFYQATCYLPYSLLLVFFILTVPALAFFPVLLRTPLLTTAIPIISILIVNLLAVILFKVNFFQHAIVLSISLILLIIATVRVGAFVQQPRWQWEKTDKYLLLSNIAIILPLIALCGLSAFMSNDALASWNYWALHFYHGEIPNTLGYPPGFPLLLAYCYKFLGNTEYQGAVKVICAVFVLTTLNTLAFVNPKIKTNVLLYYLLIAVCVFPGFLTLGFYPFYAVGYADPLLACSVTISLALFLHYNKHHDHHYLFAATLCATVAALSKQPGLLWALAFTVLLLLIHYRQQKNTYTWLLVSILWLPIGIWLDGAGAHFYQNEGVIHASLQNQAINSMAILNTLLRSIKNYLLMQPGLFLIFILAFYFSFKDFYQRSLFFIFIVPGMLLWFVFGAYDLRLGLYLIVAAGVLVAANLPLIAINLSLPRISWGLFSIGATLFIYLSIIEQINPHLNIPYHIYPLQAGRSNIYHYFGNQAAFVYQRIYAQSNIKIYAPNRIIGGIFYGHNPILTNEAQSADIMQQQIKQYRPNYILSAFCDRQAAECLAIRKLAQRYPDWLQAVPIGYTRYGYEIYHVTTNLA